MTEPALLLNDPYEVKRRLDMINQPHVKPLTRFIALLRKADYGVVPNVDPLDGGIHAKILFLLEKPSKRTNRNDSVTSGFVSRDNASQSAKTMRRFMDEAGIDRRETLLWNVVPGWNGTTSIKVAELQRGIDALNKLIALLPDLQAIVCVGRRAQSAQPLITRPGLAFFSSHHPSPNNFAAAYDKWREIPHEWRKAQLYIEKKVASAKRQS